MIPAPIMVSGVYIEKVTEVLWYPVKTLYNWCTKKVD